jgi:hypothetical protein
MHSLTMATVFDLVFTSEPGWHWGTALVGGYAAKCLCRLQQSPTELARLLNTVTRLGSAGLPHMAVDKMPYYASRWFVLDLPVNKRP